MALFKVSVFECAQNEYQFFGHSKFGFAVGLGLKSKK
jgi:hypothetical protein